MGNSISETKKDKFTFAPREAQPVAKALNGGWDQNASTQSQLDNFMDRRLGNVESTVSIFRQDDVATVKKRDQPAFEDEDGLAETNTELSFC